MSRRGGRGGAWLLALLWFASRKSSAPAGNVMVTSASMDKGGKTTTASQRELDYVNEEPASEPE